MAPKQCKPLKYWSVTVFAPEVSPERMTEINEEFFCQWCFQKEEGAVSGKIHYQMRGMTAEPIMKESLLTVFEARGIKRQLVTFGVESNNSIKQGGLAFYVMKDETRVDGPWHDPTYKPPKKRKLYDGADLACMENPRPMQQMVIDKLREEPEDRYLYWWADLNGGAGKSKLLKWLKFKGFDVAKVPLGTATQIKTSVIEQGEHAAYLVDLPRVQGKEESQRDLFSALEEIKNGWVVSAMYGKSGELMMKPPHVHIFSNEFPNPHVSSLDRWIIMAVSHDPQLGWQICRKSVQELLS